MNALAIWREVEDALEEIIDEYERVNHLISLFQDDKARWIGLNEAGLHEGVGLELGSGPGNFTQMIQTHLEGFLICLDYSTKMLKAGRVRNRKRNTGFIRGLFESLPIREGILSFTTAAYALRDSIHKERVLREISRTLKIEGVLLVVDIGKPNNPVVRGIFSLYMRHMVPILGGLAAGYGYRNPWSLLYRTYDLLPVNLGLQEMMERTLGHAKLEELAFGGLIVALAEKRGEKGTLNPGGCSLLA